MTTVSQACDFDRHLALHHSSTSDSGASVSLGIESDTGRVGKKCSQQCDTEVNATVDTQTGLVRSSQRRARVDKAEADGSRSSFEEAAVDDGSN